jgi:hypothetical protein
MLLAITTITSIMMMSPTQSAAVPVLLLLVVTTPLLMPSFLLLLPVLLLVQLLVLVLLVITSYTTIRKTTKQESRRHLSPEHARHAGTAPLEKNISPTTGTANHSTNSLGAEHVSELEYSKYPKLNQNSTGSAGPSVQCKSF